MRGEQGERYDAASWSPVETQAWYSAREAMASLREVLMAAGMQREFPYLRADLNAFGQGFVELGRISPQAAERLAYLLRLGLSRANDAQVAGNERSRESTDEN